MICGLFKPRQWDHINGITATLSELFDMCYSEKFMVKRHFFNFCY